MNPTDDQWAAFTPIRRRSDILVLRVLRDGEPHTQAELAEATGINISNVSRSLKALRDEGLVVYEDGAHRLTVPVPSLVDRIQHDVDAHVEQLRAVQTFLFRGA